MKIKQDFVTNSSSTSFIIKCVSDAEGEKELTDNFNTFWKGYVESRAWDDGFQALAELTIDMVKQTGKRQFTIHDYLSFFGGRTENMPGYVKELFFDENSEARKALKEIGIEIVSVETKDLSI